MFNDLFHLFSCPDKKLITTIKHVDTIFSYHVLAVISFLFAQASSSSSAATTCAASSPLRRTARCRSTPPRTPVRRRRPTKKAAIGKKGCDGWNLRKIHGTSCFSGKIFKKNRKVILIDGHFFVVSAPFWDVLALCDVMEIPKRIKHRKTQTIQTQ